MSDERSERPSAARADENSMENQPQRRGRGASALLYLGGVIVAAAAVGGVVLIATTRESQAREEQKRRVAEVEAGPHVLVAEAQPAKTERRLELQGEARPWASVTLYAKVSGYLRDIRVDKGDRVRKGQVLATIESPELDRQYDAAVADARYQRAEAKRMAALAAPGVVSASEAEAQASKATVAEAQVAALATQKSYEVLRAPFDGVVTARYADPGALLQSAATSQSSALPLVTVAQPERLRVYVYVDQRDAAFVRVGDAAEVSAPERPSVRIAGKVSRLSHELDPKTRMMLVEVDVENGAGALVAGSFVTAWLTVRTPAAVEVPVEALVVRAQKNYVPVLSAEDRVSFREVGVLADDGSRVRIESGLQAGERVALDLGRGVVEGAKVQPIAQAPHAAN